MAIPPEIRDALRPLSTHIGEARFVSGGDINRAARVQTFDGPVFVKWNFDAPRDTFSKEAQALQKLRATQTVRVPQVLQIGDEVPFLALEWIEEKAPADSARWSRGFAKNLAKLHAFPVGENFGFEHDNYIGVLPQRNAWRTSWPEFYRDCRLLPQMQVAREHGLLNAQREYSIEKIANRIEVLFQDFNARPSLLHGDLWSGNFIAHENETVLIDPASYIGEHEVEIAFIELFGGFPRGFVAEYNAIFPLQRGYETRRNLHQLYPLLVHLNHFDERYNYALDRTITEICGTLNRY
jgi:fructosamine-3-kinase